MSDVRKGYVDWQGHEHGVSWHPISNDVYVHWGTWKFAGKSPHLQGALDKALSWLNSHGR